MRKVINEGRAVVPGKIVCVGKNYLGHIRELGSDIPREMVVFLKPNSSISQDLISFHTEPLHYEGELSFMVENNSFSGVAFGIDLTKRGLQSDLKTAGLPWERAKAFDGSAVFSQFVKLPPKIMSVEMALCINGSVVQQGGMDLMIRKPDEILSRIREFMTMDDHDVVMTGTPEGVGTIHSGDRFNGRVKINGKTVIDQQWIAR